MQALNNNDGRQITTFLWTCCKFTYEYRYVKNSDEKIQQDTCQIFFLIVTNFNRIFCFFLIAARSRIDSRHFRAFPMKGKFENPFSAVIWTPIETKEKVTASILVATPSMSYGLKCTYSWTSYFFVLGLKNGTPFM